MRLLSRRSIAVVIGVVALVAVAACEPVKPPAPGSTPIMGGSALDANQLVAWFNANKPADGPHLTVSINDLASYFIQEGADEGVTGDIAFVQSVVETGWFRYGGQVQWWQNNFAGLGAEDGGGQGASFADARTGVRAQIQHLRAYADPNATSCAVPPLHHNCVDPRFNLVSPKGKAPSWNQMGNGNWALDPNYAATILNTYNSLRTFNGLPPL
jgi:hypothetical protein